MKSANTSKGVMLAAFGFLLGIVGATTATKVPAVNAAIDSLTPEQPNVASACTSDDADNIYFVSCGGTF